MEKSEKQEDEMPVLIAQLKLAEAGGIYKPGDVFNPEPLSHDRLVFVIAKEWVGVVGGLQELPEPLFTDVMEKRD